MATERTVGCSLPVGLFIVASHHEKSGPSLRTKKLRKIGRSERFKQVGFADVMPQPRKQREFEKAHGCVSEYEGQPSPRTLIFIHALKVENNVWPCLRMILIAEVRYAQKKNSRLTGGMSRPSFPFVRPGRACQLMWQLILRNVQPELTYNFTSYTHFKRTSSNYNVRRCPRATSTRS